MPSQLFTQQRVEHRVGAHGNAVERIVCRARVLVWGGRGGGRSGRSGEAVLLLDSQLHMTPLALARWMAARKAGK